MRTKTATKETAASCIINKLKRAIEERREALGGLLDPALILSDEPEFSIWREATPCLLKEKDRCLMRFRPEEEETLGGFIASRGKGEAGVDPLFLVEARPETTMLCEDGQPLDQREISSAEIERRSPCDQ